MDEFGFLFASDTVTTKKLNALDFSLAARYYGNQGMWKHFANSQGLSRTTMLMNTIFASMLEIQNTETTLIPVNN